MFDSYSKILGKKGEQINAVHTCSAFKYLFDYIIIITITLVVALYFTSTIYFTLFSQLGFGDDFILTLYYSPLAVLIIRVLYIAAEEIIITNEGIYYKYGLIARNIRSVPWGALNGVETTESIIGRLLGFCSYKIMTKGDEAEDVITMFPEGLTFAKDEDA